jgi:single-stranded-DNA-specific exonuclease
LDNTLPANAGGTEEDFVLPTTWQILDSSQPAHVEDVIQVLLQNRGADASFLNLSLKDLESSLAMRGMGEGAELMARHIFKGSKLLLIGDYDCDGITALAQVVIFLRDIGYKNFVSVIPLRSEGYGIPVRAIVEHSDAGLLVALDCGTNERGSIAAAREQGMDTIIIDHHELNGGFAAPSNILINPKQPECPSNFKDYCAAGLTLLFLAGLRRSLKGVFPRPNLGAKYLALAAVGTVADMAPLTDGNRILVKHGLCSLNRGSVATFRQLAKTAGLHEKPLTAGHIAYYLGPRINAAGRMADALTAFRFLVSESPDEIEAFAAELSHYNAKRQYEEDSILRQVRGRYTPELSRRRTLVMADPGWHAGIVGIVGSRVVREMHHGPAVILTVDERHGIARGSARSVPGFDLYGALKECDDLLLKWGGHRMAAGMTLSLDNLERFARRLENIAMKYPPEIFLPKGTVDVELNLGLVSPRLSEALTQLEPFGIGNPTPTFAARQVTVSVLGTFGKDGSHLRLVLGKTGDAICWEGAIQFKDRKWRNGELLDAVFQIDWDDFRRKPVLVVKDIGRLF